VITRRSFLAAAGGVFGAALYSGEIERHWIELSEHEVHLPGLASDFDGFRVAQLSDIHIELFTEPLFVREAVRRINHLKPDAVFLTGDFVSKFHRTSHFVEGWAWKCAEILNGLECRERYACLGNHDLLVNAQMVTEALEANGIKVLCNSYVPLERGGGRLWLAGVDDPVEGRPDPEIAIPETIRGISNEPVVLLSHAPDYVDLLRNLPLSQSIGLVLSGHTHGGQVRLPFSRPFHLPTLGRHYVAGWFRVDNMQLYVNRGLGTVELPFRFNCPPEISVFTLRA
jgi:hypothetical protein